MARVEITIPGERVVEDFTALVQQTTTPVTAQPTNVGLVEISQQQPTQLIAGPVGPQGVRGSRWYTGDGAPTVTGALLGDMYVDDVSGDVWVWDGDSWEPTGTNIQGSPDTGPQILAKLAPVDGAGSGLDADTLDGQDGAYYLDYDNLTDKPATFPPTLPIAQSSVTNLVSDLALKAPLASPTFTGDPKAPTPATADNDTSIATTAHVQANMALKANTTHTHPQSDITNLVSDLALKAPLASPTFTGDPKAPTPATADNDTSIATTAYVKANLATIVGGAIVSDTAPGSPQAGQLWYESDTGNTHIYVTDADSSQWVQQNVMPSGGASDNLSTAADMSIGFRTSGNRFVVNDKADLSGTDVMTVSETGLVTAASSINAGIYVVSAAGAYIGSATQAVLGTSSSSAGTVYLRPNGYNSATGQMTIADTGAVSASGSYSGNGFFFGTSNIVTIGTQASTPGTISLRPNGYNSSGSQTSIASSGLVTTGGQLDVMAAAHATGAVNGVSIGGGIVSTSRTLATSQTHHAFSNPNGTVGSISTNASATAYNTSSDERLKNVGADYDPAEAIAIIRADPVKNFQWKAGNVDAVGWIAQRSYAVNEDLATRVVSSVAGDKGEAAEEEFWGIDYGRRTPYLWAALTNALDRIDQLEARLAALEGGA